MSYKFEDIHCLLRVKITDDTVRVVVRSRDGYVNITSASDDSEVGLKTYADYEDVDDSQELIEEVAIYENIHTKHLVKIDKDLNLWLHPIIANSFAHWLSPELSGKVHFAMTERDQLKMFKFMQDSDIDYPDPPQIQ
jgi:hypothetical protein